MTTLTKASQKIRQRITIGGIVQGVGFRPFIYNLACQQQLAGFVRNLGGSVEIEIQATAAKISEFLEQVQLKAPPMSAIDYIETIDIPVNGIINESEATFEIIGSEISSFMHKAVSPDTATCKDCLQELFDPTNRRYRYPFINCTNCGPRFTIIESLPYDRPFTTMAEFTMCQPCLSEYTDPNNRRFHAQPNACAQCGPKLTFLSTTLNQNNPEKALALTIELLSNSGIVAVKGLGGFHIMCDAQDEVAIANLRLRKRRCDKPLAVMMADVSMVKQYCLVTDSDIELLTSPERPIVLLPILGESVLSKTLAPGNAFLGVMLPYTPVHHILMTDFKRPLVCTSGNVAEEPIAIDNQEAITNLSNIVDGYLLHNRKILSRYDDTVMHSFEGNSTMIRRSRGWAPKAINLPWQTNKQVLAVGGHLKNTFCLYKDSKAYISQHIGDLENLETLQHLEDALSRMKGLFATEPELIACDMHPDYLSTRFATQLAKSLSVPLIEVQHHHAHIISCMVENGIRQPAIGVAFDGIGYGSDGNLWGGEFLICHYATFERAAHLALKQMPGGNLATRQPWRMALSYLVNDDQYLEWFLKTCRQEHGTETTSVVWQQINKQINSPLTSSAGRLFDAVAAVLNIRHVATFEGQAAIELEAHGHHWLQDNPHNLSDYSYPFFLNTNTSPVLIDTEAIIPALICDHEAGLSTGEISYRFHMTIAKIISATCMELKGRTGINQICLSGGVFQNKLLLKLTLKELETNQFAVAFQRQIPTNDGGISLGQAVIAAASTNSIYERTT